MRPTLAIYVLNDTCYLLFDLPRGPSRCISLSDDYDLDQIRDAAFLDAPALKLPREVDRALTQWREDQLTRPDHIVVDCYWEDPVLLGPSLHPTPGDHYGSAERVVVMKPVIGQFPFKLPSGFVGSRALHGEDKAAAFGARSNPK